MAPPARSRKSTALAPTTCRVSLPGFGANNIPAAAPMIAPASNPDIKLFLLVIIIPPLSFNELLNRPPNAICHLQQCGNQIHRLGKNIHHYVGTLFQVSSGPQDRGI
jgi:hypothetical protein